METRADSSPGQRWVSVARGRWPSPGPLATRAVSCLPPLPAPVPSPSTLLPASPSGLVLDSVILRPLACGHGVTPRPTCL